MSQRRRRAFRRHALGANAQSSTGYVFLSNFQVDAAGAPVLDARWPSDSAVRARTSRVQRWIPHRGAEFNLKTTSAYVQDRWIASPNLTLNLGMRFEQVSSEATGGISSVSTSRMVPRLGARYDLSADGKTVLHASFSQYSGKYNAAQFSRTPTSAIRIATRRSTTDPPAKDAASRPAST